MIESKIVCPTRLIVTAVCLAMLSVAGTARAQYTDVISACGQTCETSCSGKPATCREASAGKCRLAADISCTSSDASIELKNGTDLDLKGFDITCTTTLPTLCNIDAISMSAAASKVTNSVAGYESVISGPFNTAIDCNSTSTSIVENVTIADGVIAIKDCKTVRTTSSAHRRRCTWA